jgi:hypothetical protein
MSVHVLHVGRLGNNLFQYVLGRIIAEHHGYSLECANARIEDFCPAGRLPEGLGPPGVMEYLAREYGVGASGTLRDLGPELFSADLQVAGRRFTAPSEAHCIRLGDDWGGQTFDLPALLADTSPRQIRLAGFFQRFEYYAGHRQRIRTWLRCRAMGSPFAVRRHDVLINLRRGSDFDALNWTLPLSYYEQILSGLSPLGQVYVIGTGIDAHVRQRLRPFHPIYYPGSVAAHFSFFRQFRRIVISNSTFAWWAAFLADAEEIYAPRSTNPAVYGFTGFGDVDLHMREPRYREVLTSGNPVVHRHFDATLQRLTVARHDGHAVEMSVAGVNRQVMNWLLAREIAPGIAELHRHWADLVTCESVAQLRASGLLSMAVQV